MNPIFRGRGTSSNPKNRFESIDIQQDEYSETEEVMPSPRTTLITDHSKTIITHNNSPDVGFEYSLNPYRGCEHGCIYCYARPSHEYLGMSAGLEFETRIMVKENAAELLRDKLLSKSWKPEIINLSGITDCYQPIERKLRITRSCLEVLTEFRNPYSIITKNNLVLRDLDVLKEMNNYSGVMVMISITTLDPHLAEKMEPRTSRPQARLKTIEALAEAGIPVGAVVAPVIPGLTDHEMPAILKAIANAGGTQAGYVPLRLPHVLDELFTNWLDIHFPERKERILNRIREIRGGKLNSSDFGSRMRGEGKYAENLRSMFDLYTKKEKLNSKRIHLSIEHFRRVGMMEQMTLI